MNIKFDYCIKLSWSAIDGYMFLVVNLNKLLEFK